MTVKVCETTRRYDVTYGAGEIELTVEVDFSKISLESINELASNHHEYSWFLRESNNDQVACFLKLLAKQCHKLCISGDLNFQGLLEEFDTIRGRGNDLFPPMRGEEGVKIIGFWYSELDPTLFDCITKKAL